MVRRCPPAQWLRVLPAGAFAAWTAHPLGSAALAPAMIGRDTAFESRIIRREAGYKMQQQVMHNLLKVQDPAMQV